MVMTGGQLIAYFCCCKESLTFLQLLGAIALNAFAMNVQKHSSKSKKGRFSAFWGGLTET